MRDFCNVRNARRAQMTLKEVKKAKRFKMTPGKGHSIHVVDASGATSEFHGFASRDECYKVVFGTSRHVRYTRYTRLSSHVPHVPDLAAAGGPVPEAGRDDDLCRWRLHREVIIAAKFICRENDGCTEGESARGWLRENAARLVRGRLREEAGCGGGQLSMHYGDLS